jgi:uncharacterized membrane protein|tara:strand:- start:2419 stop:2682 length:264 start_codon:yes stop_codon:yes gene_type:complete
MSRKEKIQKYLRFTRIKRACTARVISILITISVGWFLTGDFKLGLSLGAIDTVIKLFIYYGHETVWEQKMTKDIKKIKMSYKKARTK